MKLISLLLCATFLSLSAESIRLSSPDESVQIRIETGGTVDLTVLYNDRVVIEQMKTGVDLLSEFKDYELKRLIA
ncbi:MAG: hypothetical protein U5R06_13675 [candidate division KSB1 bacterium]|nr:hypothetical protein [candidate division KSB1 bacterium]